MSAEQSTVILVHGAWGGSWCWERVVPLLEERGVRAIAVDLPSMGADPADPPDLSADAAAVAGVLDETGGTFVLCGHSYGGMVVTVAAAGRSDVGQLVYLCAFMPDVGESLFALTGGGLAPWIDVLEDGRTIRTSCIVPRSVMRTATKRRARVRSLVCVRRSRLRSRRS